MVKVERYQSTIVNWVIPIFLFLVAFIWKFMFIGKRDICLDEPFTIFHAQESFQKIIELSIKKEPNPPLFTIIMHFWIKLFGIGAISVRTVPILFNALTTFYLYFTGKKIFNIWAGIIAAGLFIFSTNHFFFGSDTRTYSLFSLATAGSLYYFLSLCKEPGKKRFLIGLLLTNVVLIYCHYFGWFVIFAQFLSSFLFVNNKAVIKKIWIVFIGTGVLYLPFVKTIIKQFLSSSGGTWVQPPNKGDYIHQLKMFMNSDIGFKILIYTLALGLLVAILTRPKLDVWREMIALFIWWLVPYSIMFLVSDKIPMFTNRYILFNSIGFYLSVGGLVFILDRKLKFLIPLICIVLLGASARRLKTENFAVREIQETTNFIQSKSNDKSLILIYPQWANLGFSYYYCPEIYKQVDNYYSILNQNRIFPIWSIYDARKIVKRDKPVHVIFYQNNAFSNESTLILNHLDSLYYRTDSVRFDGGLMVCVFEKK